MALHVLVLSGKKSMLIPSSSEEDDLLARSSKKLKNGETTSKGNIVQGHWPKLGDNNGKFIKGGTSSVDKLKGVNKDDEEGSDDEIEDADDEKSDDTIFYDSQQAKEYDKPLCKTIEDSKRNFPIFVFSGKMKKRLYRAWKKAVIVKLVDRHIGFKALESRLPALWAKKGVIRLINIGNGYFVVKLSNKEDYYNALTRGPWMLYDH